MKGFFKKMVCTCVAAGVVMGQAVVPQMASAEEYEEELVYLESFDKVSTTQKQAWKENFDVETANPGQWYLYSGDVYTHNLALGRVGLVSGRSKMPVPFGQVLDIANKRYEVTLKWNHIQYRDNLWICDTNLTDNAEPFADNNPQNRGTRLRDVKIIFENSNWTAYIKDYNKTEWENIGGRAGKVINQIDGIMLYIYDDKNEYSHYIDDLCVKELNSDGTSTILYEENFDDWTLEGSGKSIKNNIKNSDCYKRFSNSENRDAFLIPLNSDNDDGCIGYVKKGTHVQGKDNYMRFVFPEVMTEGKYKISFDWSTAQRWCDYIYIGDTLGNEVKYQPTTFTPIGFRKIEMLIDMDDRTWQVNDGTPQAFATGTFENGAAMISFRQHMDSAISSSTLVDNFKIVKLVEKSFDGLKVTNYTFTDREGAELYTVPQSGSINANIDLEIGDNVPEEIFAIIATYTDDEVLLGVNVKSVSITENETEKNVDLTIASNEATARCSVFIWDSSIKPLIGALSLTE